MSPNSLTPTSWCGTSWGDREDGVVAGEVMASVASWMDLESGAHRVSNELL